MATVVQTVTFDGSTSFQDIQGNIVDWWSPGFIGFTGFFLPSPDDLDLKFNFTGSDWSVRFVNVYSELGGIVRVADAATANTFVKQLSIDELSSYIELNGTDIETITGGGSGTTHYIDIGSSWVRTIAMGGEAFILTGDGGNTKIQLWDGASTVIIENGLGSLEMGEQGDTVQVQSGFSALIRMGGGVDSVVFDSGDAGRVELGDAADTVTMNGGYADSVHGNSGNDTFTVQGGWIETAYGGSGNDDFLVSQGGIGKLNGSGGDETVTVSNTGQVRIVDLSDGTHVVTTTDDGRVDQVLTGNSTLTLNSANSIGFVSTWRTDTTMTLGSFVGRMNLFSNQAQTHNITTSNEIESLSMGDGQTMNLTFNGFDGGGGSIRLGDQNDTVNIGAGNYIRFLETREGADTVYAHGGFEAMRLRQGNDTVEVYDGGGRLRAGEGNDTIKLFGGNVGIVDADAGADKVTLDGGRAGTIDLDTGNDVLNIGNGSAANYVVGFANIKTINLTGDSWVDNLAMYDADVVITLNDFATVASMNLSGSTGTVNVTSGNVYEMSAYNANLAINIGAGGFVESMWFYGDVANSYTIDATGSFASLRTHDQQAVNLTVRTDAGSVILGNAADTVVVTNLAAVDYISTGGGNDKITTDASGDFIDGGAGNDQIRARAGFDELYGGGGSDLLNAGLGNDRLFGGAGFDRLYGGPGDDFMAGGAGNDKFLFFKNNGTDEIVDFVLGQDVLQLNEQAGGFGSLTISTVGDDLHVDHDHGLIVLRGLGAETLTLDDFEFPA